MLENIRHSLVSLCSCTKDGSATCSANIVTTEATVTPSSITLKGAGSNSITIYGTEYSTISGLKVQTDKSSTNWKLLYIGDDIVPMTKYTPKSGTGTTNFSVEMDQKMPTNTPLCLYARCTADSGSTKDSDQVCFNFDRTSTPQYGSLTVKLNTNANSVSKYSLTLDKAYNKSGSWANGASDTISDIPAGTYTISSPACTVINASSSVDVSNPALSSNRITINANQISQVTLTCNVDNGNLYIPIRCEGSEINCDAALQFDVSISSSGYSDYQSESGLSSNDSIFFNNIPAGSYTIEATASGNASACPSGGSLVTRIDSSPATVTAGNTTTATLYYSCGAGGTPTTKTGNLDISIRCEGNLVDCDAGLQFDATIASDSYTDFQSDSGLSSNDYLWFENIPVGSYTIAPKVTGDPCTNGGELTWRIDSSPTTVTEGNTARAYLYYGCGDSDSDGANTIIVKAENGAVGSSTMTGTTAYFGRITLSKAIDANSTVGVKVTYS
ncbi:MAG: hypothetical protein ACI4TD_09995, partial [Phocaeicola sp.]